jgi:hypothetical protein
MTKNEVVALFDMDGTLCDYDAGLRKSLMKLHSPMEPEPVLPIRDNAEAWLRARADLIQADAQWWAKLPRFQLGFDIWAMAGEIGYRRMILTQGPRRNPASWMGKKLWIDENLGPDTDITITRDKGLVYGRVLVDDFPKYIERWLKWRPRGIVIMPASPENESFKPTEVPFHASLWPFVLTYWTDR